MQLQAAIDHLEPRIGGEALGLRGQPRRSRLACADRNGGAVQQQPGRIEFSREVRDAELQRLEIRETRPELSALLHIVDSAIETKLRTTDRTGADVQPASVEARHRDLEA